MRDNETAMTRQQILREIETIARQRLDRHQALSPEMDLIEDLELDSLLLLTLAVEVENHFRIVLEEEDEAAIRSVGDLVETVHRKLPSEGST